MPEDIIFDTDFEMEIPTLIPSEIGPISAIGLGSEDYLANTVEGEEGAGGNSVQITTIF